MFELIQALLTVVGGRKITLLQIQNRPRLVEGKVLRVEAEVEVEVEDWEGGQTFPSTLGVDLECWENGHLRVSMNRPPDDPHGWGYQWDWSRGNTGLLINQDREKMRVIAQKIILLLMEEGS